MHVDSDKQKPAVLRKIPSLITDQEQGAGPSERSDAGTLQKKT